MSARNTPLLRPVLDRVAELRPRPEPEYFTCLEAEEFGKFSRRTLNKLIAAGEIIAVHNGSRMLIVAESMRAYMNRLPRVYPPYPMCRCYGGTGCDRVCGFHRRGRPPSMIHTKKAAE